MKKTITLSATILLYGLSALSQTQVTVTKLTVPTQTNWNDFNTSFIPNYSLPTKYDAIIGDQMPVKQFMWHTPYRNLFRTSGGNNAAGYLSETTNMFGKGITQLNKNKLKNCIEIDADPALGLGCSNLNVSTAPVNFKKQIIDGGGIAGDDSGLASNWSNWLNWWAGNITATPSSVTGGKRDIYLSYVDYEASFAAYTSQNDVNYTVTGMYSMFNQTNGYVGQMYLGPLNSGGYISANTYSASSKTPAWFSATDNTVPAGYQGIKCENNSRIMGSIEVAHYYETLLNQGLAVNDQNHNFWFNVDHFGASPNSEHFASRIGGLTEVSSGYTRVSGQKLIVQLKVNCDRGANGTMHSPANMSWFPGGNRYIEEFGRYAHTFHNFGGVPDGTTSTPGSEFLTPFIQEAQTCLTIFSGADAINMWNSAFSEDAIPKTKQGNPQRGDMSDDPTYGNLDLENYSYFLRGIKDMNTAQGGIHSVMEMMDGNEIYYCQNTEVSFDGGATWNTYRALDWQLQTVPPVRVIYNPVLQEGACLSFLAYTGSSEATSFKFRVKNSSNVVIYTSNTVNLINNDVNIQLFKLGGGPTSNNFSITTTSSNCVNNALSINVNGTISNIAAPYSVNLINSLGQIMATNTGNSFPIVLSPTMNYLNGTYTVSVSDASNFVQATTINITACQAAPPCDLSITNITESCTNAVQTLSLNLQSSYANLSPFIVDIKNASNANVYFNNNQMITYVPYPITVSPNYNGIATFTITDNRGCIATYTQNLSSCMVTSIDEKLNDNAFEIYPNPINDNYFLLQNNFSQDSEMSVEILDLVGKTIHVQKLQAESKSQKIQLPELANGCYFVKVNTMSSSKTFKINVIK